MIHVYRKLARDGYTTVNMCGFNGGRTIQYGFAAERLGAEGIKEQQLHSHVAFGLLSHMSSRQALLTAATNRL